MKIQSIPAALLLGLSLVALPLGCGGGAGASTPPSEPPPRQLPPPPPLPPAVLADPGLDNLVALTKLAGYVRHFHPSDEAAAVDWDSFLREAAVACEDAPDAPELGRRLQGLFAPFAPTVQVFPSDQPPALPPGLTRPSQATRALRWENQGWGHDQPTDTGNPPVYSNIRVASSTVPLPPEFQPPDQPFEADLGRGLRCRIPLSLWADANHTLPRPDLKSQLPVYAALEVADRPTRLAGVMEAWNVWQHFFAYFDVVGADWPLALRTALASAALDAGPGPYARTLGHLMAPLKDGHGHVYVPDDPDEACPPLGLDLVEGRWTVARAEGAASRLVAPGDVILEADGRPVADLWADFQDHHTGSPQWLACLARSGMLGGPSGSSVLLKVEALDGTSRTVTVVRDQFPFFLDPVETRSAHGSEPAPGVVYLDINLLTNASLQALDARLKTARGIILDARGYPPEQAWVDFLARCLPKPTPWVKIEMPLVRHPDAPGELFRWDPWIPSAALATYPGPVVFLIDGRAISQEETFMGTVEGAHRFTLVGQPTAGADGYVCNIRLPGGVRLGFTGQRVLKPGGERLHALGVLPTLPVARTRAGLAAGRDEILEAALALFP
ncbi:MAG TPA: S41 family peptidase [Holophagaceae bacterium]|nr:S41 family peptidase [Holophagaceae bacterium]